MHDFQALYQKKLKTPEKIAAMLHDNCVLLSDITLSQPKGIAEAIGKRCAAGELKNVTQHSVLDIYAAPYFSKELADSYHGISWFSGGMGKKAVNGGFGDVMPCYYRDIPQLIDRYVDADAFILAVTPMDEHGRFNTSTVGSGMLAMIRKSKRIFVEVNENLPYCFSAPSISIEDVAAVCENTIPLVALPPAKLDAVSTTIGHLIAEEIPNGATLQLGIGAIPDAVGAALKGKKHLGIHTEMFTDSMVGLIEAGAVDNSRKPIHTGHSVTTFAFGSQRIYDYIDHNPDIEILPVDYVNDPAVIARHPNFISVNAALEVDFFGQVCAESVGTAHVSGTGGQADYVRGATQSAGGKSFIAFPSTAKGDTISKIMPTLSQGAIVSTTKNDVDCIVTEYGIARLRGRTLSQRTKALIAIAHPKFRDELTFAAKERNIII